MHRLSMVQALSLWSDLEAAYYGKHGFGSDTAEVYMYRLMDSNPSAEAARRANRTDGIFGAAHAEQVREANKALHNLLEHFAKTREAKVEIDGRELGEWLKTAMFEHRVHIKVTAR